METKLEKAAPERVKTRDVLEYIEHLRVERNNKSASECAHLKEKDVKLEEKMIHVTGKGGNQRTVPLNDEMVQILRQYKQVRGTVERDATFFTSRRKGKGLSRHAIRVWYGKEVRARSTEETLWKCRDCRDYGKLVLIG